MIKYTAKIEAVQLTSKNLDELNEFTGGLIEQDRFGFYYLRSIIDNKLIFREVGLHEYIIKTKKGEFFNLCSEEFESTFKMGE